MAQGQHRNGGLLPTAAGVFKREFQLALPFFREGPGKIAQGTGLFLGLRETLAVKGGGFVPPLRKHFLHLRRDVEIMAVYIAPVGALRLAVLQNGSAVGALQTLQYGGYRLAAAA